MQRPPFYGMPYINPPMGYHPIGKMTNSQDPKAKAARVFVGNLNTGMVKEQELISIFSKYGVIAAVSLMRGYGFIQYTNEYHARKAVNAEHGHVLGFQPIGKILFTISTITWSENNLFYDDARVTEIKDWMCLQYICNIVHFSATWKQSVEETQNLDHCHCSMW